MTPVSMCLLLESSYNDTDNKYFCFLNTINDSILILYDTININ